MLFGFAGAYMPPPILQVLHQRVACAWLQADKEGELHTLARALLEHETLTRDDIQQVLAGTFSKVPVAREAAEAEDQGLLAGHAHHASQDSHSH